MYEAIRQFRNKLKAGHFCLGAAVSLSDPAVTEALGPSVDFFWIDLEHTTLGMESVQAHLIAARAVGVAALLRVPSFEVGIIKRVLDAGLGGIIIPQIRSAADAKQVVDACRYRPSGDRGYGPRRAFDYGRDNDVYIERSNKDIFVCVQIENTSAVADMEQIAKVPGIDCVILGPYDLSLSMGFPGQVHHPQVTGAMERVIKIARANGLFVGMGGGPDVDYARRAAEMGVNWLQAGGDLGYMLCYVDEQFKRISEKIPGCEPGRQLKSSSY